MKEIWEFELEMSELNFLTLLASHVTFINTHTYLSFSWFAIKYPLHVTEMRKRTASSKNTLVLVSDFIINFYWFFPLHISILKSRVDSNHLNSCSYLTSTTLTDTIKCWEKREKMAATPNWNILISICASTNFKCGLGLERGPPSLVRTDLILNVLLYYHRSNV